MNLQDVGDRTCVQDQRGMPFHAVETNKDGRSQMTEKRRSTRTMGETSANHDGAYRVLRMPDYCAAQDVWSRWRMPSFVHLEYGN